MQKKLAMVAILIASLYLTGMYTQAQEVIRVQMGGQFVNFEGQPPVIINGRTLVPVRGVFTLMGFDPVWSSATQTATLTRGNTTITIPVGSPTFTVDGRTIVPDVPAQNFDGRILIPLRAIVEAIDGEAVWDSQNRIAIIIPPQEMEEDVRVNIAAQPPAALPTPPPGGSGSQQAPTQPPAVQNVTVTFRNNGGSGSMQAQNFEPGISQPLRTNAFTRNRYNFAGWALSPTGAVQHADGASFTTSANQTLYAVWTPAPPVITTSSLEGGMARMSITRRLEATGPGPITWRISAGALPEGLTLNESNGTITGSPAPTAHGQFTFTVTAQNTGGTDTREFTLDIERNRWSSIVLPNRRLTDAERAEWIADYRALGGATENELAVLRYVNIERANNGLTPVAIDETLMMAARFYAQQLNDLNGRLSHNFGPYATNPSAEHGASANVARAFGGNLRWNGGNGHGGGSTSAEAVVRSWMNSPGHRRYILSPEHRFMGFGQFPGGISYLFLSDNASTPGAGTQPAAQNRTITFRANGGTGTMANQTVPNNTPTALNANTFTRANFEFIGWATTANGQVVYLDGDNITLTANRTLHTVWQPIQAQSHTITFRANGGAGTMANQTVPHNVATAINPNTFIRANFEFIGWATTANGQVVYLDGDNITLTANRTLHAIWQPAQAQNHVITFHNNGGTGNMPNQTVPHNVATSLASNTFIRANFEFIGWATSTSGQVAYLDGDNITLAANITLFAVWQPVQVQNFTITFDANGGTGNMPAQTLAYNVATPLNANAFTRADFDFIGWGTSPSGPVVHQNGASITLTGNITLFALWEPAWSPERTITFHANDGTGRTVTQTFILGDPVTIMPNTFTREGYVFEFWTMTPGGGGIVREGMVTAFQDDVDLFVWWEPIEA